MKSINRSLLLLIVFSPAVIVSLSGCGGGGGEGSADVRPVQSTSTFPLTNAIANLINNTRSYQFLMSGTVNSSTVQGGAFTGTGTVSEATTTSLFEGVQAFTKSTTVTGTLQALGQSVPLTDTSAAYFDSNYKPLGSTTSSGGYCVVTSSNAIPATAKIGDNGVWYIANCYSNSTKKTKVGTSTTSYVLEPETQATALFKLLIRFVDNAGGIGNTSATYRIAPTGDIIRVAESGTLQASGLAMIYSSTYQ